MYKKLLLLTMLSLFAFTGVAMPSVSAVTGSDFQAGRIIDDAVFFNPNTISAGTIQAVLNSKVPVCDTLGTAASGHAGYATRADWGRANGNPPPYTCLKDFRQSTPTKAAESGLCNQYNGGTQSAAEIIFNVGQACGVNPEALIVLLEKEQSLVTDEWPWSIQYRSATGYGCPDTAPCDAEYYGFFNQVYNAARQFKRYSRDATLFSYRSGRNNYIQYNPNAGCGGTNIYIQNQATAGLYNYTPYQPNAAALNNLGGSGDGCSAYGNRNFWKLFNDWFGSTLTDCNLNYVEPGKIYRLLNPKSGDYLYTSNATELCNAKKNFGYLLDGYSLSASSPPASQVPVYRLSSPDGKHFYTQNEQEKNLVVSGGYSLEGVLFYAAQNDTPNYSPVFRLHNTSSRTYFLTSAAGERDLMTGRGYVYEGVAFYTPNNNGSMASVNRFLSPSNQHFFTNSVAEGYYAQSIGYRYEGAAFNSYTNIESASIPIYRLVAGSKHFLTASIDERNSLAANGYTSEGIAFYESSQTSGVQQVYRLYRSGDGDHLLTNSLVEKNSAVGGGYRFEGAAFNSP